MSRVGGDGLAPAAPNRGVAEFDVIGTTEYRRNRHFVRRDRADALMSSHDMTSSG